MNRAAMVALGASIGLVVYLQRRAQAASKVAPAAAGPSSVTDFFNQAGAGASDLYSATAQGVQDMFTPRGIRNNNPGNIRISSTPWQGKVSPNTDGTFEQFSSPEYGLRAISHILDTYANSYGLNTVRGIISRWAPPGENDTGAYVDAVANALGVSADQTINVQGYKADLVAAIVQHENGQQPYDVAVINTGTTMA